MIAPVGTPDETALTLAFRSSRFADIWFQSDALTVVPPDTLQSEVNAALAIHAKPTTARNPAPFKTPLKKFSVRFEKCFMGS